MPHASASPNPASAKCVLRVRFSKRDDGKCAIDFAFEDGAWAAFGDPVPLFDKAGAQHGFHLHDIYHVALVCETGWSAVMDILLCGKQAANFGGPDALIEEALVLDWMAEVNGAEPTPLARALFLLNGRITDLDALERAKKRGDLAVQVGLPRFEKKGSVTFTIKDFPVAWKLRMLTWQLVVKGNGAALEQGTALHTVLAEQYAAAKTA